MNTTLTIRTNTKVKKNFSRYAQSRGLTMSAILNNIMISAPKEDAFKGLKSEDLTFEDFVAYKRAMENYKAGKYTKFEEYHKRRMAKISAPKR